ncbi:MAG: hypothetical protein AB1644_00045 [Candidatus Zixiibacteriota bacterium]
MRGKVFADAFLYDAKLVRHGKPTSFRLELFRTDSVIALGGRGYLGKGALRGRMTSDSLVVYFPATNEYLRETISELLNSFGCSLARTSLDAIEFFARPPDRTTTDSSLQVVLVRDDKKRPVYGLFSDECAWRVEIEYERNKEAWRVRELVFDDGAGVTLTARLRESRSHVGIPAARFEISWPPDALRLTP